METARCLFTGIQDSLTVSLLTWETARSHEGHLEIIRNRSWKDTLQMSVAQDDSCLPRFVFDVFVRRTYSLMPSNGPHARLPV